MSDSGGREAGQDLDMLIAGAVMGWTDVHPQHGDRDGSRWFVPTGIAPKEYRREVIPPYSTNIAAAFAMMEAEMARPGMRVFIQAEGGMGYSVDWQLRGDEGWMTIAEVYASTLPLGLCLAVLEGREAMQEMAASREGAPE